MQHRHSQPFAVSLDEGVGRGVVLPVSEDDLLMICPFSGGDDEITGQLLSLEKVEPAQYDLPDSTCPDDFRTEVQSKMLRRWFPLALLALLPSITLQAQTPQNRFEKQVQTYEAEDKTNPPPKNAILLVGDSQFFRWKTLADDLPEFTIINRGIDSFQFSDILNYFDRLVTPYRPRMIILHIGGNDVHNGKPPERVLEDFKTFVAKIRAAQPKIPIAFSSTTPGPGRWDEADKRRRTNKLLKNYIAAQKNLYFIDLWDAMLTKDGKPREELWVEDRIHPNHDGYLVRVRIMRPLLGKADKKAE